MLTEREIKILKSKRRGMLTRCNPNGKDEKNRAYREKGIVDGEVVMLSDMARRCNVTVEAIRKRIKLGWYKVVNNPNTVETLAP